VAITLLGSGVSGAQFQPNTSVSPVFTMPAGSNRRLIGVVAAKYFAAASGVAFPVIAPTLSFAGRPLSFLTRDTDGVDDSFLNQQVSGFLSRNGLYFFGLREAELGALPSSGALSAGFAPGAGSNIGSWQFAVGYWLLGNCDQGERVRYYGRFSASNALTTLAGTVLQGGASDAILVAGINGTLTGTIQITINGGALTENWDLSFGSIGARFAGGLQLGSVPLGTTAFDMTYTAPAANSRSTVLIGLRLAEAFTAPASHGVPVIDGRFSTVTQPAESLVSTVSLVAQDP
jgi:hypothetical protein